MIRIRDSAEFKRLIIALADDIGAAHMHWRLFKGLVAELQARPLAHAQSRTFWHLTLSAHVDMAAQCLCRAFDQDRSALHLRSWLQTIEGNLQLFSPEALRQRLQGNAFVDSLVRDTPRPDADQLAYDIAACTATDPLMRKLMILRNNRVAHTGARLVAKGRREQAHESVSDDDFEQLLGRAAEILHRYTRLFAAETYSTSMVGQDDYLSVLRFVEEAVEEARARSRALLESKRAAAGSETPGLDAALPPGGSA